MEHPRGRGISHIEATAIAAVVILLGVAAWQAASAVEAKDQTENFIASAETSTTTAPQNAAVSTSTPEDPIAAVSNDAVAEVIGAYAGLQGDGDFSSSSAAEVGGQIGMGLSTPVSYTPLPLSAIKTSSDTSYQAMLDYRAALQTSLQPLMEDTEPEYEIFGMYVQTQDQTYLTQLQTYAQNYLAAASSTEAIVVPADAAQVNLDLVNSMDEFAAVLDALVAHADDPIASSVLLENYNQAENDVLTAFQNLVTYEQSKTQ